MLSINYQKIIEYPLDAVLEQYFDYEHIEIVHPTTLGTYRVLEQRGARIVYEQIWPRGMFGQARSVIEHLYVAPYEMWFHFLSGRHKGVKVHSLLRAHPQGTLVDETYYMRLPNWPWLARLLRPHVMRFVDRVWQEDLDVQVCRGGWPGVPDGPQAELLHR